jgi:hypothetical protein
MNATTTLQSTTATTWNIDLSWFSLKWRSDVLR